MTDEQYDLYFGSIKIGTITATDGDFPNLWGKITYNSVLSNPSSEALTKIVKFIDLNRESARLADLEIQDPLRQAQVNAELDANFLEFVESEEWRLVHSSGRDLPILCPILRDDDTVVWRWAIGRD